MLISRLYSIPRFALPYTVADFATALLAIFRGGPLPEAFALLGDSPKFWTRSGRQALRLLLSALNLKPGSGVAIPLFTDPSLVTAIVAAGHRPVFIDVDRRFLTIDPISLEAARGMFSALVVVHLFGHMADMPALLAVAGDAPVIEDAAHAPLSYLNGRMAGSFGLASFYSFASTKYWPAGGGGLAVVNDASLARKLAGITQSFPEPSRLQELGNLILQGSKAAVFSRHLYGILGKPMRRWAEKWAVLEPCLDLKAIQRSYAAVASRQASRFPGRVSSQRANSLRLLSQLAAAEDVVLPRERPGAVYNYHLFPALLRNRDERAAVMDAMWARSVDTSMIYCDAVKQCRRFGYRGGCPVAESVADRLITLPNHAALADQDIDRVAQVFLSSLQAHRHTRPGSRLNRFADFAAPGPARERLLIEPANSSTPEAVLWAGSARRAIGGHSAVKDLCMPVDQYDVHKLFERGAVILSIDTEQIWGHLDLLNETQFQSRYPDAIGAHDKLLTSLCTAGLSATWFVVGGMTLRGSDGVRDVRMAGLPIDWTARIPSGAETTTPLWYRQSFVKRLREARPFQEIGLHGGLTHIIWTDVRATRDVVEWELAEGVKALEQVLVRPCSFSFGREQEAYHELLPVHGIRCYRGRTAVLGHQLGPTLRGALLRLLDEVVRATPPPVWPQQTLPGLWNIPSSLFLYPIGPSRTRVVGLKSRVDRFSRGLEAAARCRGIFHFCLHPENLAESRDGFSMFDDILERLVRARDSGEVDVLTLREVVARMQGVREKPMLKSACEIPSDSLA